MNGLPGRYQVFRTSKNSNYQLYRSCHRSLPATITIAATQKIIQSFSFTSEFAIRIHTALMLALRVWAHTWVSESRGPQPPSQGERCTRSPSCNAAKRPGIQLDV